MAIIRKKIDLNNLPKMSEKDLARFDAITDEDIDYSDIPELGDGFLIHSKMPQPQPATTERTRLDKWLWAARFFKTRTLANEAVGGGKVHLNGARTRPGHNVKVGDTLSIRKELYTFTILVLGVSSRRGPAKEAIKLYEETHESQEKRDAITLARKSMAQPLTTGRPNKKQRRSLNRLRGE